MGKKMGFSKLELGKKYSFKELMDKVGQKAKKGNSRKAQLRELQTGVDFTQEGYKYIVHEIYDKPLEKVDNRGGANNVVEYIDDIETLIVDTIFRANNPEGTVFLSKHQLMRELQMINDNYSFGKQRQTKLAKFMNIDQANIEEWYDSISGMLERNIQSALRNLEKEFLVFWSREITVAEIVPANPELDIVKSVRVENGEETVVYTADTELIQVHREATDKEKRFIIRVEKDMADIYGCRTEQELIKTGKWQEWDKRVSDTLLRELNVAFYYKSYKIMFNDDHMSAKWSNLSGQELTDEERLEYGRNLNNAIMQRGGSNVDNRHVKALEQIEGTIGQSNSLMLIRRTSPTYTCEMDKLDHYLIKMDGKDIRDDIKKTRL